MPVIYLVLCKNISCTKYIFFFGNILLNNEKERRLGMKKTAMGRKQQWMVLLLGTALATGVQPVGAEGTNGPGIAAPAAVNTQQAVEWSVMENGVAIRVNGKPVVLAGASVFVDPKTQRTMVPVRFISEALGAEVRWDAEKKQVTIHGEESDLQLVIGQQTALRNGREMTLDAPAAIVHSRTYVPLRFVSEALDAEVNWLPDENRIDIVTNNQRSSPDVLANSAPEPLTMEAAVQQALKTNASLVSLRLDARNADYNAIMVNSRVKDISSDLIESLDLAQQKYVTQAKAHMAQKVNAQFVKASESQTKLAVQKAYYELLNAEADLVLKQEGLQRAQSQLKTAKLSFEVGIRAKSDVLQAEAGVAAAEAALAVAGNHVQVSQLKLNEVMGVDLTRRWTLQPDDLSAKAHSMSLDGAVAQAQRQRAEVLQKQEELKVAELNVELIGKYSILSGWQGKIYRNEVEKAKLAVEEAKKSVALEVAQAYYQLGAAKEALASYKTALASAKESYRLAVLRYENGMATTLEVMQAHEELANRENQYRAAVYNHNLAQVSFKNAIGE